jgi:protein-S-isoprenylcysteine O-methyltransferase Ste14
MDLWPAFEPGLWNAWWLMLPYVLVTTLAPRLFKDRFEEPDERERPLRKVTMALFLGILFGGFIYSIFLPLKLGTVWPCIGLLVYVVGQLMFVGAIKGVLAAPRGEVFTTWAFRYTRHPIFVGHVLIFLGVAIAGLSWVFLLFGAVVIVLVNIWARQEERDCVEKLGEAYRQYIKRTPRWVGLPK